MQGTPLNRWLPKQGNTSYSEKEINKENQKHIPTKDTILQCGYKSHGCEVVRQGREGGHNPLLSQPRQHSTQLKEDQKRTHSYKSYNTPTNMDTKANDEGQSGGAARRGERMGPTPIATKEAPRTPINTFKYHFMVATG